MTSSQSRSLCWNRRPVSQLLFWLCFRFGLVAVPRSSTAFCTLMLHGIRDLKGPTRIWYGWCRDSPSSTDVRHQPRTVALSSASLPCNHPSRSLKNLSNLEYNNGNNDYQGESPGAMGGLSPEFVGRTEHLVRGKRTVCGILRGVARRGMEAVDQAAHAMGINRIPLLKQCLWGQVHTGFWDAYEVNGWQENG